MFTLYIKEIKSFFNSVIGYVIIGTFLIISGLFLWVFESGDNVFANGTADIQGFFNLAPYIFLFIIPALTMRSFSEEKKAGTMELLFTKPISDIQIIGAKFLACETLLLLAILSTLIYVVTVWNLGATPGNIDLGSTLGSYLGLFLLGTIFCCIGIFASSLTSSQIVAFILGALFCFLLYVGFELIYSIDSFGTFGAAIKKWGIADHYFSISKGVIDTRDLVYYITTSFLFLFGTWLVLLKRKW